MYGLLFEEPIQLGILVTVTIAVLFGVHNRFRTSRTLWVLSAGMAAAPALFALQHFVITDREQIERHTQQLAELVEAGDVDAIFGLCAEGDLFPERDSFESNLERLLERYDISNARAGGFAVTLDGTTATVTCGASCVVQGGQASGQTVPSRWELIYHKDGARWLLTGIKPLMIAGQKMNALSDIP